VSDKKDLYVFKISTHKDAYIYRKYFGCGKYFIKQDECSAMRNLCTYVLHSNSCPTSLLNFLSILPYLVLVRHSFVLRHIFTEGCSRLFIPLSIISAAFRFQSYLSKFNVSRFIQVFICNVIRQFILFIKYY
jgi:hypothetical protein